MNLREQLEEAIDRATAGYSNDALEAAVDAVLAVLREQAPVAWAKNLDDPHPTVHRELRYRASSDSTEEYLPLYAAPIPPTDAPSADEAYRRGYATGEEESEGVIERLRAELAESQARENMLAEEMEDLRKVAIALGWAKTITAIDEILSIHADHSALDTLLAQARADERERCAKVLVKEAEDYAQEFGHDDMGGLSFGSGDHAQVKMDRYNDLLEMSDKIRTLGDSK